MKVSRLAHVLLFGALAAIITDCHQDQQQEPAPVQKCRLKSIVGSGIQSKYFRYNNNGTLDRIETEAGSVLVQFEYDDEGRLVKYYGPYLQDFVYELHHEKGLTWWYMAKTDIYYYLYHREFTIDSLVVDVPNRADASLSYNYHFHPVYSGDKITRIDAVYNGIGMRALYSPTQEVHFISGINPNYLLYTSTGFFIGIIDTGPSYFHMVDVYDPIFGISPELLGHDLVSTYQQVDYNFFTRPPDYTEFRYLYDLSGQYPHCIGRTYDWWCFGPVYQYEYCE